MRGRIGSGKTYRAKAICAETGAQLLSVDDLTDKLFGGECPGREKLVATEAAIISYFLMLAAENEKIGRSTVIDHGFWLKAELKTAADFLTARSIPYRVEDCFADFDTRLTRVNGREHGKHFDKQKLAFLDSFFEED